MWLDDQPGELMRHWLRHTSAPMLATLPNGSVLWCNEAFENFIGYSQAEFLSDSRPILWTDLTVDRGDLKHDLEMADAVVRGDRHDYQLTKQYKSKSGALRDVVIHVQRYPVSGAFQCCLVSVYPLHGETRQVFDDLSELRTMMFDVIGKIESVPKPAVSEFWRRVDQHPKAATFIGLLLAFLLFGNRVAEVIHVIKDVFYPAG